MVRLAFLVPSLRIPLPTAASLVQLVAMIGTWRARVRQRRQLAVLDDALLKDIGLTRCDAEWEAAKPFWKA
jgi:uncharacterized protein YjiS (DUF1127 family)